MAAFIWEGCREGKACAAPRLTPTRPGRPPGLLTGRCKRPRRYDNRFARTASTPLLLKPYRLMTALQECTYT